MMISQVSLICIFQLSSIFGSLLTNQKKSCSPLGFRRLSEGINMFLMIAVCLWHFVEEDFPVGILFLDSKMKMERKLFILENFAKATR